MYEVILVDDDSIVIEFLRKMVPWEELGFKLNDSFHDGSFALEYCKNKMPDVIITDIGMPILDGITFIKKIRDLNSSTHSIILSCHGEFKYAQQALKLGTFEYVLKESMEIETIVNILKRLKNRLDKEKKTRLERYQLKSLLQNNIVSLKSKFLHTYMEQQLTDKWEWEQRGRELGIDLSYQQYVPVICYIDQVEDTIHEYGTLNLLQFSIDNLVSEIISQKGNNFSVFYNDYIFFIFYPLSENDRKDIYDSLLNIKKGIQKYLSCSITSIIGDPSQNTTHLIESLKILVKKSDQRFYYKSGSIAPNEQFQYSTYNLYTFYAEAVQEFKAGIIKEDVEVLEVTIRKWISFIHKNKFQPSIVREWIMKLILDIKLKFNTLENFETTYSASMTDKIIHNIESVYELEEALIIIVKKLVENMNTINEMPKKNEILKAKKYVMMNLDKKITLGEVAAHLHLNPSYFSRLYKQHTNENFIDFVIKTKMERAHELIEQSNVTIDRISEMLGFENKSYFFKTFKKYYGTTPREYKYQLADPLTNNKNVL
ncbi:response regulator transcription factor [Bacillus weihaiensis]|uniref:DNA-binding response regulator n=1 Tax=Bacillus weihaiensis TaxID=1547283 RepID=A0A1L3MS32_9BACI|nr:response regulator [Bacillus weihaiensis]APH05148.1 hypothetical protein A9C19_10515 [Bacillus weihaiensis]